MISGRRGDRERGPLLWAFVISLLLHALLTPFYGWNWLARIATLQRPPRERVVASTAVRIEHRSVPVPRSVTAQRSAPRNPVAPAPQPRPAVEPLRPAPKPVPKHELSRQRPQASPQPQPSAPPTPGSPSRPAQVTFQQRLATQEQRFAQEAQQFRAQNNPLSLAPSKHTMPAAFHRSYFDVPGHVQKDAVQMQLIPVRHWSSGTTICYYARYVAQFATGAGEDGTIPWPVCYPSGDDQIANPPYVHDVPLPLPPSGYVLPRGTYLTPLLARIYSGRETPR